jgi:kumamolisin
MIERVIFVEGFHPMTFPLRAFAHMRPAARRWAPAVLLAGSSLVAGVPAGHPVLAQSPATLVPLTGTVPGIVASNRAMPIGPTAPTMPLHLAFGLQGRDPAGLQQFIAAVSDPASPTYRHYLTSAQFDQRFGPDPAAVVAVSTFLRNAGLTSGTVYGAGALIDVNTTVAQAQQALHTQITLFHTPDGRTIYAPVQNPQLPAAIAGYVTGIAGLDNAMVMHPRFVRRPSGAAPRAGGAPRSGPPSNTGGYTPSQLRTAYDVTPLLNRGLDGSGRTIDLFELDGWTPSNITTFDAYYGLASPAPRGISVGGASLTSNDDDGEIEVELDIEAVQEIAPAAHINVYVGPNDDPGVLDLDHAIAAADDASVVSSSWGSCEPETTLSYAQMEDAAFQKMAAEGMDFFNASGDTGSQECGTTAYAAATEGDDPYVTAVGGTSLTLGAGDAFKSETVWNNSSGASGGGTTTFFARPSYQSGPGVINSYSNGKREYPDVSADADPYTGYDVYVGQPSSWATYGGTSVASPLWAALVELFDEDAISHGQAPYGFVNPALYALAAGSPTLPPFHDVTVGDNDPGNPKHNPVFFPATAHYDLATGLGSLDANNLALELRAASGTTTAALSFHSGWTLISLPLAPGATVQASAVLRGILQSNQGKLAAIYALSGGRWSTPAIDNKGQISGDFRLAAGQGYLAYSDAAGSYTETGTVPASQAMWSISAGWDLVGLTQSAAGPPMASTVLQAILQSGHGKLAAIYALSGGRWSTPAIDNNNQISGDFRLAAGQGYLVYSDAPANITPGLSGQSVPGSTGDRTATTSFPALPPIPAGAATGS